MPIVLEDSYPAYERRLKFLEHDIKPLILKTRSGKKLSEAELDRVKAYTVLAYAETEHFVEFLAISLFSILENYILVIEYDFKDGNGKFHSEGIVAGERFFRSMIGDNNAERLKLEALLARAKMPKGNTFDKILAMLRGKLKTKRNEVSQNNGLNRVDMSKLFDKVGFATEGKYEDLRNSLDLLTKKRSRYAHSGTVFMDAFDFDEATKEEPDPKNELSLVMEVLRGLADLTATIVELKLK